MFKKKKKKDRKKIRAYLSCKGNRRADYQKALLTRYCIVFVDRLEEANLLIIPFTDKDGLNEEQRRELERAEKLGISERVISSDLLLKGEVDDPLDIDREEYEYEERECDQRGSDQTYANDERGFELER